MLITTYGSTIMGVHAITITVEVNVSSGAHFFIVGLPDNAVKECEFRIESALKNRGYYFPRTKVIVNLAPADIRKTGSAFDLPIAMAILGATDQLTEPEILQSYMMLGELGLDGSIKAIKGALPIAMQAKKENFSALFVPKANEREAAMVSDLIVYGVSHIDEIIAFLNNQQKLDPVFIDTKEAFYQAQLEYDTDFIEVKGQANIKRALEIAAAGSHNAIRLGVYFNVSYNV